MFDYEVMLETPYGFVDVTVRSEIELPEPELHEAALLEAKHLTEYNARMSKVLSYCVREV